ncbi:S1/P1 nuclease [Aquimarina sp. U1-2]|uniref:S1/P1 nuclease n=1 Tax=Aquimarina sp. U1-2 TaxID=2823141 RepID=UPI001AED061E|nr:S1/P1 nuclease [Aquimarina sp. U1-2]MBP2832244.1 S1/P1 nuclease [Aquimarina sp. U1-2]
MKFKKGAVWIIMLISVTGFALDYDWGKTGHRVTGQIAEAHLSGKAKRNLAALLEGQSLAMVSTFADEIKSDKKYKKYHPWHYVNFPFDKKYGETSPSASGDLVQGIDKCIAILKDEQASTYDKQFHLKLLVHFIGDLHQPLHVGRAEDKGGNDIQVRWFKDGSNLHRVWDSDMIDHYGMSYTELSLNRAALTKTEIEDIQKGSVIDWVHESQNLAAQVYQSAAIGEKLGYAYMYRNFTMVRTQLQKGGLRLAKVLNDIFG